MTYLHDSMIFISQSYNTLASELKNILREFNHELLYSQHADEVLRILIDHKKGILFIDGKLHIYKFLMENLINKSELFSHYIAVFIDDDIFKYDNLINNKNFFVISPKHLRDGVSQLLSELSFTNVPPRQFDSNVVKSELSTYLIDIGLSPSFAGFKYICQSVTYLLEKRTPTKSLQKEIYPLVAIKYKTHINNIDRNIRSAIASIIESGQYAKSNIPREKMTSRALLTYLTEKVLTFYIKHQQSHGNPNDPLLALSKNNN